MRTAEYWTTVGEGVRCGLCPHGCVLIEGAMGRCGVRGCRDGQMVAMSYGLVSSSHVDPIEKKPLYHYLPGSELFSIGGWGCNMRCRFCQNWSISQKTALRGRETEPEQVIAAAMASGCAGVAYTYNEPWIWFEFIRDCSAKARAAGLCNVLVTNGFVESGPAGDLLGLIDAINVDIKSMDELFYERYCGARLGPVLEFAKLAVARGVHVEVTNLVIPTLNDSPTHFEMLGKWVADELGDRTPVHLSAYRPEYKLDLPGTPVATLENAHQIVSRHLKHVFLGNVRSAVGRDTCCPGCGAVWVDRRNYVGELVGVVDGRCRSCGSRVDVVLEPSSRR